MDKFNVKIGKKIKEKRTEQRLTRDALSFDCGISSKFLYELEIGKKGMSAKTLYKITRALNISIDALLLEDIFD